MDERAWVLGNDSDGRGDDGSFSSVRSDSGSSVFDRLLLRALLAGLLLSFALFCNGCCSAKGDWPRLMNQQQQKQQRQQRRTRSQCLLSHQQRDDSEVHITPLAG